jgi:hypothetical protein
LVSCNLRSKNYLIEFEIAASTALRYSTSSKE